MKRDPLFLQFRDLLHECPEAEPVLREWRRKKAAALCAERALRRGQVPTDTRPADAIVE
jgi:hypothetical protein